MEPFIEFLIWTVETTRQTIDRQVSFQNTIFCLTRGTSNPLGTGHNLLFTMTQLSLLCTLYSRGIWNRLFRHRFVDVFNLNVRKWNKNNPPLCVYLFFLMYLKKRPVYVLYKQPQDWFKHNVTRQGHYEPFQVLLLLKYFHCWRKNRFPMLTLTYNKCYTFNTELCLYWTSQNKPDALRNNRSDQFHTASIY